MALALMAFALGPSGAQVPAAPAAVSGGIPEVIRITRVYAGSDGRSHVDEVALPGVGGEPGRSALTRLYATDLELGVCLPGRLIDSHRVTTPRLLIIMQGAMEIGIGDGSTRVLRKGDMALAADVSGRGHTSRGIGTEPIIALTVRLPKDDPLRPKTDPCPANVMAKDCVGLHLGLRDSK